MKFLYYQSKTLAGLTDLQSRLEILCREAVWLGRRPVFPSTAPLCPTHNFHAETRFPVSKYIDTERIEVRGFVHENAKPLETSFPATLWADLQALNIPQHETLELGVDASITAAQNQRFRLIILQMEDAHLRHLRQRLLLAESFAHGPAPARDLLQKKASEVLRIRLRPAPKVKELAQEIIRRLPQNYCVVHVRRSDLLQTPAFRTASAPAAVLQALERAGIAQDAPVYLMTDERSRRWLHSLRKRRPILRYADFPRLKALIAPAHGEIDNYFLFAVEKEILQHAAKVIRLNKWLVLRHAPNQRGMLVRDVRPLYHPTEIGVGDFRVAWKWMMECRSSPGRRRLLKRMIAKLFREIIPYFALRLFRPKVLRRFRDKRKALGVP